MKRLISVCVAVLFVIGAVASVQAADNLVLATGGTAGTYYPFGGAMSKIWNSKIKDMNVTAQTSGASGENVRLINKKEVELALVQSDTLDFAFNAKEAFKEPLKGMSVIAVIYPEVVQLVVAADGPIKSFADLKGKKVGVGAPGSGTEANYRQLLDAYGLKKEDVNGQYLSFSMEMMVLRVTPTSSASCSCVMSRSARSTLILFFMAAFFRTFYKNTD